jgi:hypothetical protein
MQQFQVFRETVGKGAKLLLSRNLISNCRCNQIEIFDVCVVGI